MRETFGISFTGCSDKERKLRRQQLWAKAQKSAHDPRSGKPYWPLASLLARYVARPDGCWEWTGARNEFGYGVLLITVSGKSRKITASRLMYMHSKGNPAAGMTVCHTCDHPWCVNPDHLWEGSPGANMADMILKGRADYSGLKHSGPVAQESAQRRLGAT